MLIRGFKVDIGLEAEWEFGCVSFLHDAAESLETRLQRTFPQGNLYTQSPESTFGVFGYSVGGMWDEDLDARAISVPYAPHPALENAAGWYAKQVDSGTIIPINYYLF